MEAVFAMLNCRRKEQAPWFHNYKIQKACFLPMDFLQNLWYYKVCFGEPQEEDKQIFANGQRELVRGETYPNKKWEEDVEVLYGVMRGMNSKRWIGMAIHLKKRTITLYCVLSSQNDMDIPQVKNLAGKNPFNLIKFLCLMFAMYCILISSFEYDSFDSCFAFGNFW